METKTKKAIKDLPKVERPREKLMQYGTGKLSKSELLAILLRSGRKGENVVELAEIKRAVISVGSLNANLVHPREVFEPAIKNLAASVIVAHNHPSGALEPSEDDLEITKRLVEAGQILEIEVADHVIVTKDNYFSFKEKGLV